MQIIQIVHSFMWCLKSSVVLKTHPQSYESQCQSAIYEKPYLNIYIFFFYGIKQELAKFGWRRLFMGKRMSGKWDSFISAIVRVLDMNVPV